MKVTFVIDEAKYDLFVSNSHCERKVHAGEAIEVKSAGSLRVTARLKPTIKLKSDNLFTEFFKDIFK